MKFFNAAGTVLAEHYAHGELDLVRSEDAPVRGAQGATRALVYAYKAAGIGSSATFDDYTIVRHREASARAHARVACACACASQLCG